MISFKAIIVIAMLMVMVVAKATKKAKSQGSLNYWSFKIVKEVDLGCLDLLGLMMVVASFVIACSEFPVASKIVVVKS